MILKSPSRKLFISEFIDVHLFSKDDLGDEREANMLAVIAAAKFWEDADIVSELLMLSYIV